MQLASPLQPLIEKLRDQTPGEMIAALRRGEIALALSSYGADAFSRDFYTHVGQEFMTVATCNSSLPRPLHRYERTCAGNQYGQPPITGFIRAVDKSTWLVEVQAQVFISVN